MLKATIPPDGQWHELPEQPVSSIIAPTLGCFTDIDADGKGLVRNVGREPVEVSYRAGGPYRLALSDLVGAKEQ